MDVRQLTSFVAVAEARSFTRAAERLHVVQSAVSITIRNLERELGAELFKRSPTRVELTSAGSVLLPSARAVLEAMQAAQDAVAQAAGGLRGTVVMGTLQAQAMRELEIARRLVDFRRAHPQVDVVMRHVGGSRAIVDQVEHGELDFAVVALPPSHLRDFQVHTLVREPMALIVPHGHPAVSAGEVGLGDVAAETFIDVPQGWGSRTFVDDAFARAGLVRAIAFELNDAAAVIDFVAHGLGVAIVPSLSRDERGVTAVPFRTEPPVFETSIVVSRVRRLSAAGEALLATIREGQGLPGHAPTP